MWVHTYIYISIYNVLADVLLVSRYPCEKKQAGGGGHGQGKMSCTPLYNPLYDAMQSS